MTLAPLVLVAGLGSDEAVWRPVVERLADVAACYVAETRLDDDVAVPTLVAVGERDVLTSPGLAEELAAGIPGATLPVWAGRDWRGWGLFGGGGYAINPGPDRRDYWFAGATVTRKLGERASLGAEAFRQSRDALDATSSTYLGVGATYAAAQHWSVLAAASGFPAHTDEYGRHRVYLVVLFHR